MDPEAKGIEWVDIGVEGLNSFIPGLPKGDAILVRGEPGTGKTILCLQFMYKGVKMANSVLGKFDAVAVIEAESLQDLKKIIYEMVEQHPNVVHTETYISIFHPPTITSP